MKIALQDAHDLLASQYPLLDHLSERGQNPILNLLTVEATDQRFLDYENRISILDEAILERDKAIVERNKYIDEKEEELQELQRESAPCSAPKMTRRSRLTENIDLGQS